MLKLVNYLRENDIDMTITPNTLTHLPSAIDVLFSVEDGYRVRYLVDTEAAGMSYVTLEDMLLDRCKSFVDTMKRLKENL